MIDNVAYLVDWRVKREVEARRREIIIAKVTSVSVAPGVRRDRSSFRSALILDLMAYAASRRFRATAIKYRL
jgi:hypothetical protein